MTPAARVAAAIEALDEVLAGAPAERVLTTWGRRSRFAGARDREAVRDHVYDVLRKRRSCAALGGAETGRGLMLGALRQAGADPAEFFTGTGYGPPPLTPEEAAAPTGHLPTAVALDCPGWLWPRLVAALGDETEAVLAALRERAPLTVRVNLSKTTPEAAAAALAREGVETRPNDLASGALDVTANARALRRTDAYAEGLVEIQDAASQAVVEAVPLPARARVLDYCAGGGGKTLALAARGVTQTWAHDADPARMADLPERARRAGVNIEILDTAQCAARAPFDVVLVDAPCSGSGAWRRQPDAKWTLTEGRLSQLVRLQAQILNEAAALTAAGGTLAYATCSLLEEENGGSVAAFCARAPEWRVMQERRLTPLDGGDGFYVALLTRGPGANSR